MTTETFLTPWLIEKIKSGEVILFLGAGATYGAKGSRGEKTLNGLQLRDAISDKFLGGKHKDKALTRVSEFAKYESTLFDVQSFIKTIFNPLKPASFHELITQFRWFAIVTTNYDLIIERAYENVSNALQHLEPIIRDGDNFSKIIRDNTALPYLKLHGCLTAINDENLPLILASEEYAKFQRNRERLFKHFADWARERPVIFVGYDISDPNIQQILFDLTDLGIHRPPYVLVDPGLDEISTRYWQAHRFFTVKSTFEDFLTKLDSTVPSPTRGLGALVSQAPTSLRPWLTTHLQPTERLLVYLQEEMHHVHPGVITTGVDPKDFYRGKSIEWGVFEQNLDIKRRLSDEIIVDVVLSATETHKPRLFLLKAHAGAGTSVLLKRVAWDAAKDFEGLIFLLKKGGVIRSELIEEIAQLVNRPFTLIVDDAIPHLNDIKKLMQLADKETIPISILVGARSNEWNVAGQEFEADLSELYELKDLTEREITDLVDKLEVHKSLGELQHLSKKARIEHFKNNLNKQLLVALHEATSGKPFEEIVFDEFKHITPIAAQYLYLDICTLHRLGVPVRAGLISRVSEITFEYFEKQLFAPLEHVLITYFDSASRDYVYTTRHPLIAEFVFTQALTNPVERAAQIKRIIRHMDIDYESDREAFGQLIRGKTLADLFVDKAIANDIFLAAEESGASKSFIYHQKAVFELNHPNGNMRLALKNINEAEDLIGRADKSVEHTKAVVLRRMALEAEHPLEKDRLRNDAKIILQKQIRNTRGSHPFHTLGQLLIDILRDQISKLSTSEQTNWKEFDQRGVSEIIRETEECISNGMQLFPGDEFLFSLDADLGALLKDEPRALTSLQQANNAQPSRAFIAVRLARSYIQGGQFAEACGVLEKCLSTNTTSKEAHLELAKIYIQSDEAGKSNEISYHLKRSFTDGDSNLQAQLLYYRHEFLYGNKDDALAGFKRLGEARTASSFRNKIQYPAKSSDNELTKYTGVIKSKHESYCFVTCVELRGNIFVMNHQFEESEWDQLKEGAKVKMNIGFALKGPQGLNAKLM